MDTILSKCNWEYISKAFRKLMSVSPAISLADRYLPKGDKYKSTQTFTLMGVHQNVH